MYDEVLLTVDGSKAESVKAASLPKLELREREHLQEWLLAHPYLLGDGVQVVASEYDRWQTASGEPVLDRLDILGLDPDGRLVVAELKRDVAPATVHMQAINYAAMVSRLSIEDIADLWAHTHGAPGYPLDHESVLAELQSKWLVTAESIRKPRIVLVAAAFPTTVTASVVWLNERGVDITLIRFRPYQVASGETLVTFTRTYPVPSVEDFTIGRRRENGGEVDQSASDAPWTLEAFTRLATQANEATMALLDLCASDEASGVSVQDIVAHANITVGQVKGQLASFTMRLRNPKYGFSQSTWPVDVVWLPGGVASYSMDPELGAMWRQVRSTAIGQQSTDSEPTVSSK
jgi:hypothetical protein